MHRQRHGLRSRAGDEYKWVRTTNSGHQRLEAKPRHLLRPPSSTPHQGKANYTVRSDRITQEGDEARVQSLSSRGS